ncbi:non-receptor serine/threonine protein kinase [Lithospermum erythrorhizon]|uniref:Non-receptor serine/threonine protein kinase n=1 Tax=Lithospermum erythrorhizon TaxID=34254 RepID=A0AAV3P669_LITER
MGRGSERKYPVNADDFQLYEEIGDGVSATVYRALCVPLNEIVAIKVLDLEKCNNDLDGIRREVHTMTLIDHPNVLRAHCSFTTGHSLWVVMPYMYGGSCLHIMKSSFPDGFEEAVIATLLREVLKALVYLHSHGHIHRDVKAGNILIDSDGSVKLADFGVTVCMFDAGDRQRSRNTFVGTPCWMAPEVMQQLHGYDFKADIWSFGITALELAHGHAPFSKYPPMKVLLMTLQNAPPGLDYERDKKFSKSFKELVAACLVKDPKKRPSSEKLLKHHFFKHARSTEYLARSVVDGLSPLGDRYRMLKAREADLLVQNKSLYEDKDHLSQQEYMKGISAWNFNLEDLKNQAAMIPDDDTSNVDNQSLLGQERDGCSDGDSPGEGGSPHRTVNSEDEPLPEDDVDDSQDLENSLAGFPMKPLQALKGCFDICEDDIPAVSPTSNDATQSGTEQLSQIKSPVAAEDQEVEKDDNDSSRVNRSMSQSFIRGPKRFSSGSLVQENIFSPKKPIGDGYREPVQARYPAERNYSGPLQSRQRKDSNHSLSGDDTSEGAIVQRKGRFKVTSADISPKGPTNSLISLNSGAASISSAPPLSAASVLPSLHGILQQNTMQKDEILKLIKYLEQSSANLVESAEGGASDSSQISSSSARERELEVQVLQLQQSIGSLVEELQRQKMKNAQLEKKLNFVVKKEDKI